VKAAINDALGIDKRVYLKLRQAYMKKMKTIKYDVEGD